MTSTVMDRKEHMQDKHLWEFQESDFRHQLIKSMHSNFKSNQSKVLKTYSGWGLVLYNHIDRKRKCWNILEYL